MRTLRNRWSRLRGREGFARIRRRTAMAVDRVAASSWKRIGPARMSVPLDDDPRFALITVNFSTTRYLKLMLLTLSEQEHLGLLHRIVIVDNGSLDGGREFLDRLDNRIERLHVVRRRHWLGHGPGMRAGVRTLNRIEATAERPTNLMLFCDTDIVFRNRETMAILAGTALSGDLALFGEVRVGANERPDVQASFFAVRRDAYAPRDVPPPVHDGAPAYRLQQAIVGAGLAMVHVPTNHGRLILHRGRAGVEAAGRYRPRHHYAAVRTDRPHFVGVPGGAEIWSAIETQHAGLLEVGAEAELLDILAGRFQALGTAALID